jgi:hypothetical protein
MVGKPNLNPEAAERTDIPGASSPTPGLPALDQEREASMADEGGASGAAMESDDHRLENLRAETDELDFPIAEDDVLVVDPRALILGAGLLAIFGFLAFRMRR